MQNNLGRRPAGMTLIEVAVFVALSAMVAIATYQYYVHSTRATSTARRYFEVQEETYELSNRIRRLFRQRLVQGAGDPPPFVLTNSAGFFPTGAGNCQDLWIRTRRINAGVLSIQTISIRTQCAGLVEAGARVHPNTACGATGGSQIVINTFQWPNENSPVTTEVVNAPQGVVSNAVCFRQIGTGLVTEIGRLLRGPTENRPYLRPFTMPTDDRANGAEYF